MDLNKIASFLKTKRKALGITQEELADRIFVTEKAISRWETGRGTPDISLLLPLAKELNVSVSEILNGEDKKNTQNDIEKLLTYNELTKKNKMNWQLKFIILCYVLSIFFFLIYLRFEYNPKTELNYFIRLLFTTFSSCLILLGNTLYKRDYVEKIEDKKKMTTFSQCIVFIYYLILLFNMVFFARFNTISCVNLIPFKTITEIIKSGTIYSITINILGNFLIFMPLEYFLIELFSVKKKSLDFLFSLFIILAIEISQYIFKVGVFDIDDIFLCVLGMQIFSLLYHKKGKHT